MGYCHIVDILLVLEDSGNETSYVPALEDAGYILRLPEIERYLLLRDRLREDAEDRKLYARTKRDLASKSWPSMDHYAEAKTEVVEGIIARAADVGGGRERASAHCHSGTFENSISGS